MPNPPPAGPAPSPARRSPATRERAGGGTSGSRGPAHCPASCSPDDPGVPVFTRARHVRTRTFRCVRPPGGSSAAPRAGLRSLPRAQRDRSSLEGVVGHDPGTSLPWTGGLHRNTYIVGHRVGFPGTASDRVLDEPGDLGRGDVVVLRGENGGRHCYEVTESFVASPEDSWVMDRVRDKDMVTLQTCVGPNFSKRLIVRAERV